MERTCLKEIDISVVIPVYNEESNIIPFLHRLIPVINKISQSSEIIFVLDPCPDNTEQLIRQSSETNSEIKLIKMSRRFGQSAATMAGLAFSNGKRVVVIDVDLQDPPEVIPLISTLLPSLLLSVNVEVPLLYVPPVTVPVKPVITIVFPLLSYKSKVVVAE